MSEQVVILDTETTGLKPLKGDRVIEIACIKLNADGSTETLLDSILSGDGKRSGKIALATHRISDSEREGKPAFSEISNRLTEILQNSHLVIYNKTFDIDFIEHEYRLAGQKIDIEQLCSSVTCAMELAMQKFNLNKRISLDASCKRYSIDLSSRKGRHGAAIDALLTAKLYQKLLDKSETPLTHTPQDTKNRLTKDIQIPRAFRNPETNELIQVNHCKNATCENFGVPPKNPKRTPRSERSKPKKRRGLESDYRLVWNRKTERHQLLCTLCNSSTVLMNNRAYYLESRRVRDLNKFTEPSCPNVECSSHEHGIYSSPEFYKKNGFTRKPRQFATTFKSRGTKGSKPKTEVEFSVLPGSQRYRCKSCGKNFSVALDPQQRHYRRDINEPLFLDLMGKSVLNRSMKKWDINPQTIYDKIDFYYQQALAFSRYHETVSLPSAISNKMLILSCDRQQYLSNWNDAEVPSPTAIMNTSTVDNISGYIFDSTINFDFQSDAAAIYYEHERKKEYEKERYFQRYAQYVLHQSQLQVDEDDSATDVILNLPHKGLLVHQTYSIFAHFERIRGLVEACPRVLYLMDRDSGFSTGFASVFAERIKKQTVEAYLLNSNTNNSSSLLDKATSEALKSRMKIMQDKYPNESDSDIWKRMWSEQFLRPITTAGTRSEWVLNPNPNASFDALSPITIPTRGSVRRCMDNLEDISLHGVDNWFQILRRTVNMLERPITSATNSKRWNAYAGYNPSWMAKLIEIARVYRNFCVTNEDYLKRHRIYAEPTTPAERLGLSTRAYDPSDILGFSIHREISPRA